MLQSTLVKYCENRNLRFNHDYTGTGLIIEYVEIKIQNDNSVELIKQYS